MIQCFRVVGNNLVVFRCNECIQDIVYALVQMIPIGKVTTYSSISKLLDINPRLIARILSLNRNPVAIPCHRVVRSNGELGGYTLLGRKSVGFKRRLLALEGVKLIGNKVAKKHMVSVDELL